MLIAQLITDKYLSLPFSLLFLSLFLSASFSLFEFDAIYSFHFLPFSAYNKNKRCLPSGRNSCQCCGCGCSVIVFASTVENLHEPPPPESGYRPFEPSPSTPLPSRRTWVLWVLPLLPCAVCVCVKILKTSAKFMYSASNVVGLLC